MRALSRMLAVALLSVSAVVFAQSDNQSSFNNLKALAGAWQGQMDGMPMHVSLRVTSMGNTLMHEMQGTGRPDDPITMFHLDNGQLVMTHYCDAGNQPHFVASTSSDGKTVTFDFVSATNLLSSQAGHMQHVVFHIIDANHHTELWQFAMANGKIEGGLLDLTRAN